jgi:hypothetical protein
MTQPIVVTAQIDPILAGVKLEHGDDRVIRAIAEQAARVDAPAQAIAIQQIGAIARHWAETTDGRLGVYTGGSHVAVFFKKFGDGKAPRRVLLITAQREVA